MPYYEVTTLLVQKAQSFKLPIEDLHLEVDPDRDLIA
jgi:hypothetical protein